MIDVDFWKDRRVLLTGHTGFKGSWLALWLTQLGAKVTGIGLPTDTDPHLFDQLALVSRLKGHHLQDIRDLAPLQKIVQECQPEVVLHLAAQPLVRRSYRDPLGTWATNVQGSLHILEALRPLEHPCAVVMITTDKVYENREWDFGYRENDRLGGHDPYSASKAAAEIAIASWRDSFCGQASHQTPWLAIASARAGNVIGGGDWAEDRIVPDAIRSLAAHQAIPVRRPEATRPWQHVLEPLSGYLLLAQRLAMAHQADGVNPYTTCFNFGPSLEANQPVRELVQEALKHWPGEWVDLSDANAPHEAGRLHLQIDKAHHQLGWKPRWPFSTTVQRTVRWYHHVHNSPEQAIDCCIADIVDYTQAFS
ncbi:CDP-glucose 4,6-dehydratase [Cyanobium sp. NIES-981]|uniref:CDP-glucose 4,6-dehydratase n=1 Tax=Cyanobium sp. NIES-981 TaxID=1851505 RepID=UPI00156002DB|nr:CDP-glucose 4,6-dehydratase [Cyanobium sp. NIES-981]